VGAHGRPPLAAPLALATGFAACNLSAPSRFFPDAAIGISCPTVYTSTSAAIVDDECIFSRCSADLVQSGCALRLDYHGCSAALPDRGVVDPDGNVVLGPSAALGACSGHPGVGDARSGSAAFTFSCVSGCRVDFIPPPFPSIASVRSIAVASATPLFLTDHVDHLRDVLPFLGYITGAVLLDDRIAVVSSGSLPWLAWCKLPTPLEVVFYDRRTMLEVERTRAADCLTRLVLDPGGRGFFGLYGGSNPRIGLFDAHARLVRSASVALPLSATSTVEALALERSDDGTRLYAGYNSRSDGRGYLAAFASADLSAGPVASFPGGLRAARCTGDAVVVSLLDSIDMVVLGPSLLDARGGIRLAERPTFGETVGGFLVFHHPSSRLAVSAGGTAPGIQVISNRMVASVALYYESPASAWAGSEWPLERSLIAYGLTAENRSAAAWIARFDPRAGRFLPGSTQVGVGAVQEMLEDADGDLWLTLPWSATLARVHPEPTR
jgi:hypothetical protein